MKCAYCGTKGQWPLRKVGKESLPFCSDSHFAAYKATVKRAEKILTEDSE